MAILHLLLAQLLLDVADTFATNLGPCGSQTRFGQLPNEKLFFLKTIKTAGSSTRFVFLRFARSERMAMLRSRNQGHILLDTTGRSQRWVSANRFEAPQGARARPAGTPAYDIALDHATLDRDALAEYLPAARWVTVSRDVASRVASAVAMFHNDATPLEYFDGRSPAPGTGDPARSHLSVGAGGWTRGSAKASPSRGRASRRTSTSSTASPGNSGRAARPSRLTSNGRARRPSGSPRST